MRKSCLLCGGNEFKRAFPGAPVRVAEPQIYRITHSSRARVGEILRCRGCGLMLLPDCASGEARYAAADDAAYVADREQRIENAGLLLDVLPGATRGRLLEVGCACGFLLQAARQRGFDVIGVELSGWATEYAARNGGLRVLQGTLASQQFEPEAFDVVVLADVIEHLADPSDELRRIHRLLRPGGLVLILTPDIGSVTAKIAGRHWWALLDDHCCYFSRATLARVLGQTGFRVRTCRALGRKFRAGHWVGKLSQYNPLLHRTADKVFRLLRASRMPVYLNLFDQMVCVAEKPDAGLPRKGQEVSHG